MRNSFKMIFPADSARHHPLVSCLIKSGNTFSLWATIKTGVIQCFPFCKDDQQGL